MCNLKSIVTSLPQDVPGSSHGAWVDAVDGGARLAPAGRSEKQEVDVCLGILSSWSPRQVCVYEPQYCMKGGSSHSFA